MDHAIKLATLLDVAVDWLLTGRTTNEGFLDGPAFPQQEVIRLLASSVAKRITGRRWTCNTPQYLIIPLAN